MHEKVALFAACMWRHGWTIMNKYFRFLQNNQTQLHSSKFSWSQGATPILAPYEYAAAGKSQGATA
jgi:hypothetical protein